MSRGRTLEGSGQLLRIDLRPQRSSFRLIGRIKDRADLIALVPFEQYVAGVIGAELPKEWPLEVFKAQAVAARSFALARMRSASARAMEKKRGWFFEGTTTDQMFDDDRSHERAIQAARETAGVTLVEHGEVVSAHYHSDCGGQTDEPATVWGGGPRFGAARHVGCTLNPRAKWRLVRSFQEIQAALQQKQILPTRFQLASLQVTSRSAAGRALSVAVVDALSGRSFSVTGERLREALGFSALRRTLFEVKMIPWGTKIELHGPDFLRERRIQGSLMGSNRFRTDMPRLIQFYQQGRLHLDHMISGRIRLDQINEGFAALKAGGVSRQVIEFAS